MQTAELNLEDTLVELGASRGRIEAAIANLQAVAAGSEEYAAAEARTEIARLREDLTQIDDRIAGTEQLQRRRLTDQQRERNAAEVEKRRHDEKALRKALREGRKAAEDLLQALTAVVEAKSRFSGAIDNALSLARPYVSNFGALRETVISPGFSDLDELIIRELAARGVQIPGVDHAVARDLISQADLLVWLNRRLEALDELRANIIKEED